MTFDVFITHHYLRNADCFLIAINFKLFALVILRPVYINIPADIYGILIVGIQFAYVDYFLFFPGHHSIVYDCVFACSYDLLVHSVLNALSSIRKY